MTLKLHIWWITQPFLVRVAIKWTSAIVAVLAVGFAIK